MVSVEEYIDFLFDKLNELMVEDISYSDYDQMTDWLGGAKILSPLRSENRLGG